MTSDPIKVWSNANFRPHKQCTSTVCVTSFSSLSSFPCNSRARTGSPAGSLEQQLDLDPHGELVLFGAGQGSRS